LAGSRPVLVVAKGTNVARIAVPDVVVTLDILASVCVEFSGKAGFAGGVEGGVGGWVGAVFASWADGTGGGGVVLGWIGSLVRIERSSRARGTCYCAFGVGVRALRAGDASGFAHCSCGRAVLANCTARASGGLVARRSVY
jgi:hypothetical protein